MVFVNVWSANSEEEGGEKLLFLLPPVNIPLNEKNYPQFCVFLFNYTTSLDDHSNFPQFLNIIIRVIGKD